MLTDARIYEGHVRGLSPTVVPHPPAQGARWCAQVQGKPSPDDTHVHLTSTAVARVDHGRWIVDCPCGGAQYACRTDHRLFCVDCGNEHAGGAWVLVEWPDDADVAAIEELLLARPFDKNRNWRPPETIKDLKVENAAHRVGA